MVLQRIPDVPWAPKGYQGPMYDTGAQVRNVLTDGAVGDGVTDDRAALVLADAADAPMLLPAGKTFLVSSHLTLSGKVVSAGGKIRRATGVNVTINGAFEAGDYPVFEAEDLEDGAGFHFGPAAAPSRIPTAWFGVYAGAPSAGLAAKVEAAIESVPAGRGSAVILGGGTLAFDRDVEMYRPVSLRGTNAGRDEQGTKCSFPPGYSGFRGRRDAAASPGGQNYGFHFGEIRDIYIHQTSKLTSTTVASHVAGSKQITLADAGDWRDGQIIRLAGAGATLRPPNRRLTITAGSNVATYVKKATSLGNPCVYVGQHIDIVGAGLPAGTTVTTWSSTSVTLSNNATVSVTEAEYDLHFDLWAEILSGGGTTTLSIDNIGLQSRSVTNSTLRHADTAIVPNLRIHVENVTCAGWQGAGLLLLADAANNTPTGRNVNMSRFNGLTSVGNFAGIVVDGRDANQCAFFGGDVAHNKIGVLDMSFLGNHYFGLHTAFNVGYVVTNTNARSAFVGCYSETGTGNAAPAGGCAMVVGGIATGSGTDYTGDGFGGIGHDLGTTVIGGKARLGGTAQGFTGVIKMFPDPSILMEFQESTGVRQSIRKSQAAGFADKWWGIWNHTGNANPPILWSDSDSADGAGLAWFPGGYRIGADSTGNPVTTDSRYRGVATTAALTTDPAVAGDYLINRNPTGTRPIEGYLCVASGTPGAWRAVGAPGRGTTAARPTMQTYDAGFLYWDTDLGKLIHWNGSAWDV